MLKEDFIRECAAQFDIHPRDLMGKHRFDFVVRARQALYLALRRRGWSYPAIGRFLDRDHSTVIYGAKQALYRTERDPVYAAKVEHLTDLEAVAITVDDLPPEEPTEPRRKRDSDGFNADAVMRAKGSRALLDALKEARR